MIRALVVEDERRIRDGIVKFVKWETLGIYEVKAAESGEKALELCREYIPDIVISDIRMPGITGISLLRRIKESFPDAQEIIISGYSDKEYLMSAIELGVAGYVEKPIDVDKLSDVIRKAVAAIPRNKSGDEIILDPDSERQFREFLKAGPEAAESFMEERYHIVATEKDTLSQKTRMMFIRMDRMIGESQNNADRNQHYARLLENAKSVDEMRDYVRAHMKEALSGEENQGSDYRVKKTIREIEKNLENPELSIQTLADAVYLTPAYLSNLFKKETGKTIGQYISEVRIERAKELLTDPSYKLYQVSRLAGYDDANYFAKTFKKQTGMTPSEYREKRVLPEGGSSN